MESQYALNWEYPKHNFSQSPKELFTTTIDADPDFPQNFARLAKWSPDGSVALAQSENHSFQFLGLPLSITAPPATPSTEAYDSLSTHANKVFHQASPILDFTWYPSASLNSPASFCFVASVRECPVKLLDAADGRLRASYKIVDHRERQIAPHSLAFNLSADKLYCGFEDAIEVFDVQRPGEGTRLSTTPSKKTKEGLKGIISALAFCPSYDPSSGYFAAGSLTPSSSNIALFTEATGASPVGFVGTGGGIRAAVTQIQFNPLRPHILYASFRRDKAIYSWDLRGDSSAPIQIFQSRTGEYSSEARDTNQKMRFDVDAAGQWLAIGDQGGDVSIFDLSEGQEAEAGMESVPKLRFHGHNDGIGSVGFHPSKPLLLTVSGSRHFHPDREGISPSTDEGPSSEDSDDSTDSSESTNDEEPEGRGHVIRQRRTPHPFTLDSSIRLWSFDQGNENG